MNSTDQITLQVGVKAVIKNHAGAYLALNKSVTYPGETVKRWDIPGGRINPGETTTDALAREVTEETGLAIGKIERVLTVQDILRVNGLHVVRITYLVTCQDCEQVSLSPSEHSGYRWVSLPEFRALNYDPCLEPVFERLLGNS